MHTTTARLSGGADKYPGEQEQWLGWRVQQRILLLSRSFGIHITAAAAGSFKAELRRFFGKT